MNHQLIEKKISSGRLESHCLLAGNPENPALVLLHGAGPGASASSNWLHCAADLAEHFYVVAPDLIGFGLSDLPKELPKHIAGWIGLRIEQVKALMDEMKIDQAHMVGNSMGGALALHLTLEAPERFKKVMLMGAIGAPMTWTPEMARLLTFYEDPRIGRYREMMHSFVYDPSLMPEIEDIVQMRFKVATDPGVRAVQEIMFAAMKTGIDELILAPSALQRMPHEFAIVHGRQDRIVPLETSLYFLRHLKNAELHVLDRCGHWAQTQRWDAMFPLMINHFNND